MTAQFPQTLTHDQTAWSADDVLIIEAENCRDYMINLIVSFRSDDAEVSVTLGLFPHWRCIVPLRLGLADGSQLFIPRTPGRFKATVSGANVHIEELKEIHVRTSAGAEHDVICHDVSVHAAAPTHYPMPTKPLVDALQQWTARDWPGKAHSVDEVRAALTEELQDPDTMTPQPRYPEDWSQYGGWIEKRFAAGGFFRAEHDGQRWWLVDPEGCAFWSIGINCIRPQVQTLCSGIEGVFASLPDKQDYADCWSGSDGRDILNAQGAVLRTVFGDDWKKQWIDLTWRRMRRYAVNSIANWSDEEFIDAAETPYVFTMKGFAPDRDTCVFRDFPDVYADDWQQHCRAFAQQLAARRDDPFMIGYFMANEPQWAFVNGFDLGAQLLQSDHDVVSRRVLIDRLKQQYGDIAGLNAAWHSNFKGFADFDDAVDLRACPASQQDTRAFTADAVDRYMRTAIEACRAVDANHMNLGCRWAWIHSDYQLAAADLLDAFSFNCYQVKPDATQIEDLAQRCGKPLMIGEFHIGALDRGLPSGGLKTTQTMAESVEAYRYYIEQAAAIPSLVGAHYFLWNDQHVMGRPDGENMQIGLHDITARPYPEWEAICAEVNSPLYEVIDGMRQPCSHEPKLVSEGGLAWN